MFSKLSGALAATLFLGTGALLPHPAVADTTSTALNVGLTIASSCAISSAGAPAAGPAVACTLKQPFKIQPLHSETGSSHPFKATPGGAGAQAPEWTIEF